ncbi:MAG: MscL family protein, partial [Bacteroidota bacterium]
VADPAAPIEEIAIGYGKLVGALVDFVVIALTVFIVVKFINRIRNKAEDPKDKTVTTPKDIELLDRISGLLEQQNELLRKEKE